MIGNLGLSDQKEEAWDEASWKTFLFEGATSMVRKLTRL